MSEIEKSDTDPLGASALGASADVEPDVQLADVIRILHPDALPEHRLKYYLRLP